MFWIIADWFLIVTATPLLTIMMGKTIQGSMEYLLIMAMILPGYIMAIIRRHNAY